MDYQSRNPAPIDSLTQQRLASVLSAAYSDSDIRDAVAILDARFVENTPESRRLLRAGVQADVINSHAQIVRDFAGVSERLARIGGALKSINDLISDLRARSNSAVTETAPVLDESSGLLKNREETAQKQVVLSAFTQNFTISDDEREILIDSGEPVDARFFNVLHNVKRIHNDCSLLLSSGNDRAGTEIMDNMAKLLNSAFQKLYRWVLRELKALSLESPQVNSGIRKALRVLAERPTLLQNCLDFFAEVRQKIIVDSFYVAMTGAPADSDVDQPLDRKVKPIEMYAHDPLRYVGDVLAWLHSTAVGEQETLEVLFIAPELDTQKSIVSKMQEGLKSEPWVNARDEDDDEDDTSFDVHASLLSLVNKDMELVIKPLRTRIEQAITSQESSTLSYRLFSLINFYRVTFEKLLGVNCILVTTIQNLEIAALRQFHHTLSDHVRTVRNQLPQATDDLSPPEFLVEALSELSKLLKTFTSSLGAEEDVSDDLNRIFELALDPYLECCDEIGHALAPKSRHIFLFNCLYAVQTCLRNIGVASDRSEKLELSMRSHLDDLIAIEHGDFLEQSGIKPLITILEQHGSPYSPGLSDKLFQNYSLQAIGQKLDAFLSSALLDARKDLARLSSRSTIDEVVHSAVARFISDFERLEEGISEALSQSGEGTEEEMSHVWPRTAAEVRVLLS
ncbi:oligomeric complex COG6 [Ascodesmis nigricans]|uniref:Conserved oligomeric Golgi complex subunit 6 n=1 Tax=Ascodesmis nigricans TaxID=341454 RepID=A0A4S2MUV1_9PEZI|nr:oligomeric complex COG6 [Ascodesmis nigricans]